MDRIFILKFIIGYDSYEMLVGLTYLDNNYLFRIQFRPPKYF